METQPLNDQEVQALAKQAGQLVEQIRRVVVGQDEVIRQTVVALIAPRPMLFMTGDQDYGSPVEGIEIIENRARPAWRLYGREADFQSIIYPGLGHVYLPEMWEKTVDFLNASLKKEGLP